MTAGHTLSISIVTYAPDLPLLERVVNAAARSAQAALDAGVLTGASLTLVDNGPGGAWADELRRTIAAAWCVLDSQGHPGAGAVLTGHGNLGYGRGHNLALQGSNAGWHLILNPDALLEQDSLSALFRAVGDDLEVTLAAPRIDDEQGTQLFLCKRYPTVLDLALRGFAPASVQRLFAARLAHYEMRDVIGDREYHDAPILSGCFMLARTAALKAVGGFSDDFFMYFEDFDLSLRMGRHGRTAYVPVARATHLGGHAARKGLRHVLWFGRSAITFFSRHGWKLW